MSRYIDADALPRHGQRGGLVHWKDIEDAPSIDIVRCKECKHWWNEYGDSACMLHSDFTVDADDFCIEWYDSGDIGEDTLAKRVEEYRTKQPQTDCPWK